MSNALATNKQKTIGDMFDKMLPQVQKAAPKHMDPTRMIRVALTTVKRNPELLKCDPSSLMGAFMESVQLGLEVDSRGLAYLLPYGNDVQFQVGYKGLISLVQRSGKIKNIYAEVVYESEKDNVEITLGLDRFIKHEIDFTAERTGRLLLSYAVAVFEDGTKHFEYCQEHHIKTIMKSSKSANSQYSPWNQHPEAMWKKSAIKKLCKYLDLSPEVGLAVAIDSEQDSLNSVGKVASNVIDITPRQQNLNIYTPETEKKSEEPQSTGDIELDNWLSEIEKLPEIYVTQAKEELNIKTEIVTVAQARAIQQKTYELMGV